MLLPRPAAGLLAEMPLAFQQVAAALARVARAAAPQHADFAGVVAHAHYVERLRQSVMQTSTKVMTVPNSDDTFLAAQVLL